MRFPLFFVPGAVGAILAAPAPLAAWAQPGEPPIYSAPLQALTPSGRGVVFPAKLARKFGNQCSRQSPVGYWTTVSPSRNEIKRLETALPKWMGARQQGRWKGRFADYRFQYGALVRDKKRVIYINAVPAERDPRQVWRRGPEVVCDGGPNFWGVEFDAQSGTFQNAAFNGMV